MPLHPRAPMPRSLALDDDGRTLVVTWRDGRVDRLNARALRLACPCARCVDEVTKSPLLDPATVRAELAIRSHRPVGNYAAQFAFADGHGTGLYTYESLRAMGAPPAANGATDA